MIYEFENITAMVEGRKGQSRRVYKLGEAAWSKLDNCVISINGTLEASWETIHYVTDTAGHIKWMVGRDYAVQPGRGEKGVWWKPGHKTYYICDDGVWSPNLWKGDPAKPEYLRDELASMGWRQLRIRITAIRRERVQDISEEDAIAEGYPWDNINNQLHAPPVTWYWNIWRNINIRKGTRWADNPECWVLSFEVVK